MGKERHKVVVVWEARDGGRPKAASCSCGRRCRHLRRQLRDIRLVLATTKALL